MYLSYYGLRVKPFAKTPDPAMLYLSPAHEEALARMEQAVEDRELMLVTGDIGCGKTTLSRALMDRLPDTVRPALIINPRLSPNQLLRTLVRRLADEEPKYFKCDLIEQIYGLLYRLHESGVLPLLIIDEAQAIPGRETFEEVRLLTNFQLDQLNLMALILIGQPELLRRLRHPSYEALRQRIGLRYHLGPLSPAAVGQYLEFRLRLAGREAPLFSPAAADLIAELSQGVPRWINNLAAAALMEGFGREAELIGEEIVRDVALDLGLGPSKVMSLAVPDGPGPEGEESEEGGRPRASARSSVAGE